MVANKLITIPDNPPYEPKVKPAWWNNDEYCEYHKSKGHTIGICHKLKNVIQDIINKGDIEVDGHTSNEKHVMFKEPFPKHDKGKSKANNQANYAKMSYDYHLSLTTFQWIIMFLSLL